MNPARKVVFIFGPTCVGKTELAVRAVEGIGEIISVDSMQVYRGLDCGTAKPTDDQCKRVKHHLVSIVPPDFRFSAGDFKRRASRVIDEIYRNKMVPVLVGGTGLYFRALEYNLSEAPAADIGLRNRLYREEEQERGVLYRKLQEMDPETAASVHPNDTVRIVRAIEVCVLSGRKFSDYIRESRELNVIPLKIGITLDRQTLYERIERRCAGMISRGLAGEVYRLLRNGYDEKYPSMKGLGYSHFIQYFKGCQSYEETVRLFIRDSKRYAKRQFTWFRKEKEALWFGPGKHDRVRECIESFIGDDRGVYDVYRDNSRRQG